MDIDYDVPTRRKEQKPFPFFDLPRGLRNAVYGLLARPTLEREKLHDHSEDEGYTEPVYKRVVVLLCVSRQFKAEYDEEISVDEGLRLECTKKLKRKTLSVLDILRSYRKALPMLKSATMGVGEEFFSHSANLSQEYTGFARTHAKWLPLSIPNLRTLRIDILVNLVDRADDCTTLCRELIKFRDNLIDNLPGSEHGQVTMVCEIFARNSSANGWTASKDPCYLGLKDKLDQSALVADGGNAEMSVWGSRAYARIEWTRLEELLDVMETWDKHYLRAGLKIMVNRTARCIAS